MSYFPRAIGSDYRNGIDLRDPQLTISLEGITHALILGGMANPRKCEEYKKESYQCNVEGPLRLGRALLMKGIMPLFFSTDYVFDGKEESYSVDALPTPLNEYGRQKAELEKRAKQLGAIIIRLSKVYGVERGDGSFFDEMLALLEAGKKIPAAVDQFVNLISVQEVIEGIALLCQHNLPGIYHLSGKECESRYTIANLVATKLNISLDQIIPIKLADLDSFTRPSRVFLQPTFPAKSWREGVEQIVSRNGKRVLGWCESHDGRKTR
ncbi:MAG: SDR family oxidoreductase [Chlamydiales bacterium]